MLHHCFLDDSKDQHQEFAYVCGGFHGNNRAWTRFDKAWGDQLRAEGLNYYKTSEYRSLTGEFARFRLLPKPLGRQAADLVMRRLERVGEAATGIRGIAMVVPVSEYEAVVQHDPSNAVFSEKVYPSAFMGVLLKATQIACKRQSDKIFFAHDDEDGFDALRGIYRSFGQLNPRIGKHLQGFLPLDDKVMSPLQLSDMFANSLMRTTIKTMKGEDQLPKPFMWEASDIFFWSEAFGKGVLVANLERLNLPVPDDLDSFRVSKWSARHRT